LTIQHFIKPIVNYWNSLLSKSEIYSILLQLAPVFYDSNGQPLPYEAAEYLSEEYYENYWAPGEEYPDI